MTRILLLLFFITYGCLESFAQREADSWYFGKNASLEFNIAGVPVSFLNSAMNTAQGSASISDKSGNLLFYTNGDTVWNRLHQPMTNGAGLMGNPLATQPTIIVPKPGSDSTFYVFTVSPTNFGLRYSTVIFSTTAPNGQISLTSKNLHVFGGPSSQISGKITAVRHANNQDVWVIIHQGVSNVNQNFIAFKVTNAGVSTTPIVSPVTTASISGNTNGYLKASPTGNFLGAGFGLSGCFLFSFDNKTGQVSNPLLLRSFTNAAYYGLEFSPDGSKLYASTGNQIEQFNLAAGSNAAIVASRIAFSQVSGFGAMQLATNGKIYIVQANNARLWQLNFPNQTGIAANLAMGQLLATGTHNRFGFPNFIQSYFAPPRFNYTGICAESPVSFTIPNQTNIDSVKWNFGDPASFLQNTSSQLQPSHTFNLPGVFTVQLNIYQQGFHSVFERQLTIMNKPLVQLPKDTSVCEGTTVFVTNLYPPNPFNERWVWSTGNSDSTLLRITHPGTYWLELTNGVCTTRDSIVVKHRPKPRVNLGLDRTQCGNASIVLDAGNPGATYRWQPNGETTQTITVTKPGSYSVAVTSNRCTTTDAINLNINAMPGFEFGDDITVCEGEPVLLRTIAMSTGTIYTWSDSSKWPELEVKKSGKYWATVNSNGCIFTDTVNVTFKSCPPPIIPYIPNIISPNNDNLNDKFEILKIPVSAWSLKIYNRWGQQIFATDTYSNTWPEKTVATGTYYYILEEPETGRKFKGWLEVVR